MNVVCDQEHRESRREYRRKYYQEHKESIKEKHRKHYQEHRRLKNRRVFLARDFLAINRKKEGKE